MDCTIKEDKIVLVVPPFASSTPPPPHPNTFFPGTALFEIYSLIKVNNIRIEHYYVMKLIFKGKFVK